MIKAILIQPAVEICEHHDGLNTMWDRLAAVYKPCK